MRTPFSLDSAKALVPEPNQALVDFKSGSPQAISQLVYVQELFKKMSLIWVQRRLKAPGYLREFVTVLREYSLVGVIVKHRFRYEVKNG